MRLTSKPLALILLLVIFGGVLFTSAFNWWSTETSKVPATFSEGEAAGQYNPADIRGSYTFGDIEASFGVPSAVLAAAFGLPAGTDAAAFQVKELESLYADLEFEIGTSAVRLFTAFYTGLPYDLSAEESYLPAPAVDILLAHGGLSAERLAYLAAHRMDLAVPAIAPGSEAVAASQTSTPSAVDPTPEAEEGTVRGNTTFQELLDWGVRLDRIEAVLGEPMPAPTTVIKDFVTAQGKEFAAIRDELQAEVDDALEP